MAANSAAVEQAADVELVHLLRSGRLRGEVQPHRLSGAAALRRLGVGTVFPQRLGADRVGRARNRPTRPLFWRRMSKPERAGCRHGLRDGSRARLRPGRARVEVRRPAVRLVGRHAVPGMRSGRSRTTRRSSSRGSTSCSRNGSLAWNYLAPSSPRPSPTRRSRTGRSTTRACTASRTRGHEFTDVLTDKERTALIEYLKTL